MRNATALHKQIDALDFAILEMELFLDTHPTDHTALAKRAQYMAERAEAIAQYEAQFGAYEVTRHRVRGTERWTWIDDPWPWEYGGVC